MPYAHTATPTLVTLMLAVLSGCGSSDGVAPRTRPLTETDRDGGAVGTGHAPTFHRDVRPLLQARCAGCHRDGGIAPFVLAYDERAWKGSVPDWAASAVESVLSRQMPPWMPDDACRDYEDSRRLTDAEVAVFTRWRDTGFAVGSPSDFQQLPPPTGRRLGPPDLRLTPTERYTPNTARPDDYRCFLLPAAFDTETYLLATDIMPGARRHVHHVILYAVDAAGMGDAEALDAAEPGPGYTCFGGPRVDRGQNVGGWAPGMVPALTPEDSARVLPAGTRLIMQVHYNTSGVAKGDRPDSDLTMAHLWLMPTGTVPSYRVSAMPLANLDIQIRAGDGESVQTKLFPVSASGTIVGVMPHMHTLGARIELVREIDDTCLVHIPTWDFHWQQTYRFTKNAFVPVARGERLKLTCVYDNSGRPREDGAKPFTPADVHWGEGTADEMCLAYVDFRTPFGRSLDTECPSYHGCVADCAEHDSLCLAACSVASEGCRECTGLALAACAPGRCEREGLALQSCNGMCSGDCPVGTCAPRAKAFFACMEPAIRDGTCDALFQRCGA